MWNLQEQPAQAVILVVDDTPANLRLLKQMLSSKGYQVKSAPSGILALKYARATPPDLILLDIRMPDMNGFEVIQELKIHEATREIPVIFISALSDIEDKVKAFKLGGVDYVTKPFQEEEVLIRVETHLRLHKLQRCLEHNNAQLQEALENVKTLKGLLPICANCKKIRDDQGGWQQIEIYIKNRSEASFSHGICPECRKILYPGISSA